MASEWLASSHCIAPTIADSDPVVFETLPQGSDSNTDFKCTPESVSVGCSGPQLSLEGKCNESARSIMELLLAVCRRPLARSHLRSADLSSFKHEVVPHLPVEFNGNVVFELPPLSVVKEGGMACLDGMDRKFDGHAWTETATTNIVDPSRLLSFKYVKCMGHLRCYNPKCRHISEVRKYNDLYWAGSSPEVLTPGKSTRPSQRCKLVCKLCKTTPLCLVLCLVECIMLCPRIL